MNELNVNINYQGVKIDVKFNNLWNILSGYSGTGKTFLMEAIKLFCIKNQIPCVYCDYNFLDKDNDQIKSFCKNAEVILLDNADLYLTNELFLWFKETKKMLIVCMKDISKIDMKNVVEYIVNYENKHILLEAY